MSKLAIATLLMASLASPTVARAEPLKVCAVVNKRTGDFADHAALHLRRECRQRETEIGEVDPGSSPLSCAGRLWSGGDAHAWRFPSNLCKSYDQFCLHVEGTAGCEDPGLHYVAVCCTVPGIASVDTEPPGPTPMPTFVPPTPSAAGAPG